MLKHEVSPEGHLVSRYLAAQLHEGETLTLCLVPLALAHAVPIAGESDAESPTHWRHRDTLGLVLLNQ
eukprot:8983788-Pyramimonas_sp.AAC.1